MATRIPFSLDEVPLQDDRRLELCGALADYDNYYEISQVLQKNSQELVHAPDMRVEQARNQLERDRQYGRRMAILLHAISRDLLEAIILGTVSHFFLSTQANPSSYYDGAGPGTYVAAMSIVGRNGRFINVDEYEKLITALEKYCLAYQMQKLHQGVPSSVQEKDLDQFARRVDKTFGARPPSKKDQIRFIQNDNSLKMVRTLVESFKRRCAPLPQQGRCRTTWHTQGPLLVGCSNQLDECMPHHYPSSGLTSTTYTWALILCLIKSTLNLMPHVVVRPVIRTWENEDLGPSEILVSALAASYVFQDGFNVVGGGSQKGDKKSDILIAAKEHVFMERKWVLKKLDATRIELKKREKYVQDAVTCADFVVDKDIQSSIKLYSLTIWSVEAMLKEKEDLYAKQLRKLEEKKRQLEEIRQKKDQMRNLHHILCALLGEPTQF